ncbi:hypothetical protein LCGC14_2123300 [marine sediment metagenome]|uniref:Uncharacterized protein n=1 Tax=marine sediment metagenome TaxID=412755 RepID=A0A0F9E3J6_9ZZZZ
MEIKEKKDFRKACEGFGLSEKKITEYLEEYERTRY